MYVEKMPLFKNNLVLLFLLLYNIALYWYNSRNIKSIYENHKIKYLKSKGWTVKFSLKFVSKRT